MSEAPLNQPNLDELFQRPDADRLSGDFADMLGIQEMDNPSAEAAVTVTNEHLEQMADELSRPVPPTETILAADGLWGRLQHPAVRKVDEDGNVAYVNAAGEQLDPALVGVVEQRGRIENWMLPWQERARIRNILDINPNSKNGPKLLEAAAKQAGALPHEVDDKDRRPDVLSKKQENMDATNKWVNDTRARMTVYNNLREALGQPDLTTEDRLRDVLAKLEGKEPTYAELTALGEDALRIVDKGDGHYEDWKGRPIDPEVVQRLVDVANPFRWLDGEGTSDILKKRLRDDLDWVKEHAWNMAAYMDDLGGLAREKQPHASYMKRIFLYGPNGPRPRQQRKANGNGNGGASPEARQQDFAKRRQAEMQGIVLAALEEDRRRRERGSDAAA